MRVVLSSLLAGGGVIAFLLAQPVQAAGPNDTCLACHSDAAAKAASGKPVAVDAAMFAASVHGALNLQCTGCHAGVSADKFPHGPQPPVECAACHAKAAQEYSTTIHGQARAQGNTVAAICTSCHGAHDIRRSKDPASATNHANLEATCSKCHGSDAVVAQGKLPGGNIGSKFHDSIHGKALKSAAQMSAPECTDCHGTHSIHPKSDPRSNVSRARIPDICGTCHKPQREAYVKGMHGKLRQDGVLASPGCTDCHSAHGVRRHDEAGFQTEVIKECGGCHVEYISTYRDTFHGQVTALGYARMATCASCHGAHEVLPASNPASKVSKENRLATCQKCHAGASANFASFDPHANRHDRARDPVYFYAAKFMEILLIGVFAFFGIHTMFWLYRELAEKFGGGNGGKGR